jgi:hypothetical protein
MKDEYSVAIYATRELHGELALAAKQEGVSLNQYVMFSLSKFVASEEAELTALTKFRKRHQRAKRVSTEGLDELFAQPGT